MTVKREYAYVQARAWMNTQGSGVNYHLGCQHDVIQEARSSGFAAAGGTDDFLVATVVGDELTNLEGAGGEALDDWESDDFATVAAEVGLKWNAA